MKKTLTHMIILIVVIAIFQYMHMKEPLSPDLDNVELNILSKEITSTSCIYRVELKNNTSTKIVQNEVYFSFPIITQKNGRKLNEMMLSRARGNKLNIASGESIELIVEMPLTGIDPQIYDTKTFHYIIRGFFEKVDDSSAFQIIRQIGAYEVD